MKGRGNPHVVRHPEGGWAVRREGSARVSSRHTTQQEAISSAIDLAKAIRGEVVIHDRSGRIRDRDSYGNDPCPPRDREH